jgi:hypothetical protein
VVFVSMWLLCNMACVFRHRSQDLSQHMPQHRLIALLSQHCNRTTDTSTSSRATILVVYTCMPLGFVPQPPTTTKFTVCVPPRRCWFGPPWARWYAASMQHAGLYNCIFMDQHIVSSY